MNQSVSAEPNLVLKERGQLVCAWGVHVFTAAGAIVGLFALIAFANEQWLLGIAWMAVAMAIDGMDGALARFFKVKERTPQFDGTTLDNMVDYFNYVIVPSFFVYMAELIKGPVVYPAIAAIMLCSAYQFCQVDAKTEDHYFTGFPSYWNILAYYAFLLQLAPATTLIIVAICCALVFIPVRYIYPSRTRRLQAITLFFTLIWCVASIVLLVQYPDVNLTLAWATLAYVAYYFVASLILTFSRRRT